MKHPIRRRLMYLGFRGLQTIVRLLPLRAARGVGTCLGLVTYGVIGSQRRLTLEHLAYAFGNALTPSFRQQVARGVFCTLGQNAMEWLKLPSLSAEQVCRLVDCEGVEHLRAA